MFVYSVELYNELERKKIDEEKRKLWLGSDFRSL